MGPASPAGDEAIEMTAAGKAVREGAGLCTRTGRVSADLDLADVGRRLAFTSSHRASIAIDREGWLELYRASKAALNMLARGIDSQNKATGLTVIRGRPRPVATRMGTLDGTVAAEMGIGPSVRGVADIVERHHGSDENLSRDWKDRPRDG